MTAVNGIKNKFTSQKRGRMKEERQQKKFHFSNMLIALDFPSCRHERKPRGI